MGLKSAIITKQVNTIIANLSGQSTIWTFSWEDASMVLILLPATDSTNMITVSQIKQLA